MSGPHKILVVANETLTGDELLDAVRAKVGDSETLVVVIAPVNAPREGYVVYDNTRRAAAGRRLDRTLTSFRDAGIAATGHVVDNDPGRSRSSTSSPTSLRGSGRRTSSSSRTRRCSGSRCSSASARRRARGARAS